MKWTADYGYFLCMISSFQGVIQRWVLSIPIHIFLVLSIHMVHSRRSVTVAALRKTCP